MYIEISIRVSSINNRVLRRMLTPLLDDMDQDNMADGGLDDMMENELANMAERDAEVEMVMAEFDAGDTGGMDAAD